jgi:hypothetical protein
MLQQRLVARLEACHGETDGAALMAGLQVCAAGIWANGAGPQPQGSYPLP